MLHIPPLQLLGKICCEDFAHAQLRLKNIAELKIYMATKYISLCGKFVSIHLAV